MASPPPERRPWLLGSIQRALWLGAGILAVGVGGLGIVVPGLPTTPLFIVAAWCFSRSSPRLEQWVLDLRGIGPMVRDHRSGLGMPRRAKVLAISMMTVAVALSVTIAIDRWPLRALVIAAGVAGLAYVGLRIPTKERVLADRAAAEA